MQGKGGGKQPFDSTFKDSDFKPFAKGKPQPKPVKMYKKPDPSKR